MDYLSPFTRRYGLLLCTAFSLIVLSCSSTTLLTRENKPDRVVLSSLQMKLWHFDGTHFNSGDYTSLPVALRDQNASSADLNQIHRTLNEKENVHIKNQLNNIYSVIQANLKHNGITLLPADYLKQQKKDTPVDAYGFPNSKDLKTAASLTGASLQIILYLDTDRFDVTNVAPGRMQLSYTPKLTINLVMTNADGQVIWNDSHIARAIQMTQIDKQTTGGETLNIQQESSIPDMVRRALGEMLGKLPLASK